MSKLNNNLTTKFEKELAKVHEGRIVMVSGYRTRKEPATFKHSNCGYIWEARPQDVLKAKVGCPKCAGNIKLTTEDIRRKVTELTDGTFVVTGEYKGSREPIEMLHIPCGNTFNPNPSTFINKGSRCPHCSGVARLYTHQVAKEISEVTSGEYVLEGDYTTLTSPIIVRHTICGNQYSTTLGAFRRGGRCRKCRNLKQRKTPEWFISKVSSLVGDEYQVLTPYTKAKTPVKMLHTSCGHAWRVTPDNFLRRDSRCPRCKESKGEELVASILDEMGVHYTRGTKFQDCRYKRPLPFDFYLPEYNICVEYDGAQHFRPVNFGGVDDKKAEELHKLTRLRDGIKTEYCLTKGIPLLRIPHTLPSIQVADMLKEFINKASVVK